MANSLRRKAAGAVDRRCDPMISAYSQVTSYLPVIRE